MHAGPVIDNESSSTNREEGGFSSAAAGTFCSVGANCSPSSLHALKRRENDDSSRRPMSDFFHKLYPLVFDSITEGVFTIDNQFRITSFNREAERITGIERDKAIGRRCHDVLRANICQTRCALRKTLETGEQLRSVRVDILNSDMEPVPVCVSTAVLKDQEGRLIGGVEIIRDLSELESLRKELSGHRSFGDIIGASPAMQEIFRLILDVAASDATVLLEGASGTGKELVAQAIHDQSPRSGAPFVRVNCGALPDTLLESELFGYVKGAFTDARQNKPGRFAQAHGGTILLDEIGDVSPAFQVKLLRVLQDHEFTPLGGTRLEKVDVRVIAATNRDLADLVRQRAFREDLYYRLRVVPITIPPLRERRQDIPLLIEHFRRRFSAQTGKAIGAVSPAALERLYDHDYPGNVRELENIIERAFVVCHDDVIDVEHLPAELSGAPKKSSALGIGPFSRPSSVSGEKASTGHSDDSSSRSAEAQQLVAALEAHRWNRTATAKALGIGRNTLWRRMKGFGLLES